MQDNLEKAKIEKITILKMKIQIMKKEMLMIKKI